MAGPQEQAAVSVVQVQDRHSAEAVQAVPVTTRDEYREYLREDIIAQSSI
jgi:hypothetical protein